MQADYDCLIGLVYKAKENKVNELQLFHPNTFSFLIFARNEKLDFDTMTEML